MSIQAQMQLDETLDALKNAEAAGDTDSARILADRAARLKQEVETSFSEEDKSSKESAQRVSDSPITAAAVGAVGGGVLGKPAERLIGKAMGATYKPYGNVTTGEPSGWKWDRKTGFGAGLGETVQEQSEEYKRRTGPQKYNQPKQIRSQGQMVETKKIPGKALTIEQSMANAERDALEARIKAEASKNAGKGAFWKAPSGFGSQVASVAGKTLGGAATLGMGAQAALDFDKMVEALKKKEYAEAAKAARSGGLSAVGALGSAATFIPHPLAKGVGTALGVAAPLANAYLESKGYAKGGKLDPKAVKKDVTSLWEKFGYDPKKIASQYPEVLPPVEKIDPKSGKAYMAKQLSPEAMAIQKARQAAQKEIELGMYSPFFDITKRSYVNPANYSMPEKTLELTMPKKAETLAKHRGLAQSPEATARLEAAYGAAEGSPKAHGFYQMKQLEDAFIKELGPEAGMEAFKNRFALPMAATTGGQTPNANLMMTAMHNYFANKGQPIPSRGFDIPYPVGGNKLQSNIDKSQELFQTGTLSAAESPKRYNFASNFMGYSDRPTIDEQMMGLFNPAGKGAPDWYGVNEEAVNMLAKKRGVDPVNYQEVAWAGAKGYEGQPMIEEINQMIHRTSRITGQSPEEVLRGFVRGNKPMYGITGLGAIGAQESGGVNNPN